MMFEIPSYNPVPAIGNQDLLSIKGDIEAVRTYPTRPNSRLALFDEDDDVFFVVKTDQNGYKSEIKRFRYIEEPIETPNSNYASKEDLNSLREDVNDVKQSIQQLTDAIRNSNKHNGSRKYRSNGTVEATIVDG